VVPPSGLEYHEAVPAGDSAVATTSKKAAAERCSASPEPAKDDLIKLGVMVSSEATADTDSVIGYSQMSNHCRQHHRFHPVRNARWTVAALATGGSAVERKMALPKKHCSNRRQRDGMSCGPTGRFLRAGGANIDLTTATRLSCWPSSARPDRSA
jgi:hypothetical protein